MASKFFERRSIRNQLKIYLETKNWLNLVWAEGFNNEVNMETILPPFISIILDDLGRQELEMGPAFNENTMFSRRAQINVYMESEDRVNAITDDISDFLDLEVIVIKDNNNNSLGTMLSDTESIVSDSPLPTFGEVTNLLWEGIATCTYEAHYPNG